MIEKQITVFECEKCKRLYTIQHVAENCCKQYHCEVCGVETPQYLLKCSSCAEKARFEKARKMTEEEYDTEFPGNMVCYGDEYFSSVEDLLDRYNDEDCDIPAYCYGTMRLEMELDPDGILEAIEQEADCEDLAFSKKAYKEFREFAKAWNAKYGEHYYMEDQKVVVLIGARAND